MEPTNEALSSAAQQKVRSVVKMLPEDSLSMAWRSSLNEKLVREAAARRRKDRIAWFLRPALGLGLACTLAVLMMVRTPESPAAAPRLSPGGGLEAALVTTHRQSTYAWDVAGAGLSPMDLSVDAEADQPRTSSPATGWNEEDLDNL